MPVNGEIGKFLGNGCGRFWHIAECMPGNGRTEQSKAVKLSSS
jgi:hypothetical protein